MVDRFPNWGRRVWVRVLLLGAGALIATAALGDPAAATGTYPGETLSLALSGSSLVGKETNFVASGNQTDVNQYNSGGGYSAFSLEVFAKDPRVDPTCSPSYPGEQNASISDPSETQIVIGQGQGTATTFSIPFKAVFARAGPVLLCAYSEIYGTDTAASAQLKFDVGGPAAKPTLAQRATAACKAEQHKLGNKKFKAKYGHKNPFGKCVSKYERTHKG
jgi:hypothetical protein